jgi:hypothetical protein
VRRRRSSGRDGRRKETPQDEKCHTWPHARSVVTFGMAEQEHARECRRSRLK